MKRFTVQHVLGKMRIINATRPAPFPGTCPTRVAWAVKWSNGKLWTYLGRPSRNSYDRFVKLTQHPFRVAYNFREFDRQSVIGEAAGTERVSHRQTLSRFTSVNTRMMFYYKPHEVRDLLPGSRRMFPQKINGHWVYCSVAKMSTDMLDSYSRWLRMEGLV